MRQSGREAPGPSETHFLSEMTRGSRPSRFLVFSSSQEHHPGAGRRCLGTTAGGRVTNCDQARPAAPLSGSRLEAPERALEGWQRVWEGGGMALSCPFGPDCWHSPGTPKQAWPCGLWGQEGEPKLSGWASHPGSHVLCFRECWRNRLTVMDVVGLTWVPQRGVGLGRGSPRLRLFFCFAHPPPCLQSGGCSGSSVRSERTDKTALIN